MVFACASAQVAVNGSTTREMMDALNICLLLVLAKFTLPTKADMLSVEMSAKTGVRLAEPGVEMSAMGH